jgi:hypothetical protein
MKTFVIAAAVAAALASTAGARADDQPDRRTDIHHSDGTTSTVRTDRAGTQVITPNHGGGQFGRGVPHDEVVKEYTRPDSQVERR